ncbi:DUF883 C-terminal domain-containing protein [bacterium]|nr:DUF883 C-terminal domain-containing protein [bacterium]
MANQNDFENVVKKAAEGAVQFADSLPDLNADTVEDVLQKGRDLVRKNPGVAIAAGFGVGLLIGVWLSRRD